MHRVAKAAAVVTVVVKQVGVVAVKLFDDELARLLLVFENYARAQYHWAVGHAKSEDANDDEATFHGAIMRARCEGALEEQCRVARGRQVVGDARCRAVGNR